MIKKAIVAFAVAGVFLLGGSSAAMGASYPVTGGATASDTTPGVGQPVTITVTVPGSSPQDFVYFTLSGPSGGSLASLVHTAVPAGLQKPVANSTASVQFSSNSEGTFVISAADSNGTPIASQTLVVSAANNAGGVGSGGSSALPATGGSVPVTAIWLGAGALGLGSIAVVGAVARRRAQSNR